MSSTIAKIAQATIILILASCQGYHWKERSSFPTLCVPYVVGDKDGRLTNEIVHALEERGSFSYRDFGSDLTLVAEMINLDNKSIGYRRDRDGDGMTRKNLKATEGRQTLGLKAQLIDSKTNQLRWGPYTGDGTKPHQNWCKWRDDMECIPG